MTKKPSGIVYMEPSLTSASPRPVIVVVLTGVFVKANKRMKG